MARRLTTSISLTLLVLLGWRIVAFALTPSDGTIVHLSDSLWRQDRMAVAGVVATVSPLRPGDQIRAVEGTGPFTYVVDRAGQARSVTVVLGRPDLIRLLSSTWAAALTAALLLLIGWFVFANRPGDQAAQALLLIASLFAFGVVSWLLGAPADRLTRAGPGLPPVLGELALAEVWGATAYFAVVLPGTSLRPGRRLIVLLAVLPLLLHGAFLLGTLPTAHGRLETLGRLAQVSLVPMVVMPVVTSALMVLAYRRTADPGARRRLRWVLGTFVLAAVAAIALWAVPMMFGRSLLAPDLLPTVMVLPTAALGAAVLRYRLFDIEIILRRSLLAGSLTAFVLAVYLSVGWAAGRLAGAGGTGVAAVVGTCLVAFGIAPLSRWLQHRVGRLVYGSRDDPFAVVSRLSRLDTAAAPQQVLAEVTRALAQALRLSYVGLELTTPSGLRAAEAHYGTSTGEPSVVELDHAGVAAGRLLMDVGSGQEPLGPADRRLLRLLAAHLGAAGRIVLLNAELRESRRRLVLAREEERRRLHRALRGSVETVLEASGCQVAEARSRAAGDRDQARRLLEATIIDTRAVISEIRGLVRGLRPPVLDQLGLVEAIRERIRREAGEPRRPGATPVGPAHIAVTTGDDLGRLPAAVEVAAFRIAVEAARQVRGADGRFRLELTRDADLRLDISYDGGFTSGPELEAAAERARELGGELALTARAVRVRLPIHEAEMTG
jgi:two-component system NarL family sensor kinase